MVEATELVQQPPPSSDQNVLYLICLKYVVSLFGSYFLFTERKQSFITAELTAEQ